MIEFLLLPVRNKPRLYAYYIVAFNCNLQPIAEAEEAIETRHLV